MAQRKCSRPSTRFRVSRTPLSRAQRHSYRSEHWRLLSPAGQVWALQQAECEREKQWAPEARRAEMRRLEQVGKSHLRQLGGLRHSALKTSAGAL